LSDFSPDRYFNTYREYASLLKFSFACGRWSGLLRESIERPASRLARAFAPGSQRYPREVRAAFRGIPKQAGPILNGFARPQTTSGGPRSGTIRLINELLYFDGVPDWKAEFDDPERIFALHRWNWLLTKLTDDVPVGPREWGLALMHDWLDKMGGTRQGPAWTSYTTGERICNAILFLALANGGRSFRDVPADIAVHLAGMAKFLSRNLEYNGPMATGNHVLNNARALYFAGQTLDVPGFRELGLTILEHDLCRRVPA
jgi:hypothetical protein